MKIDEKLVKKVAKNSMIEIGEKEIGGFVKDFEQILEIFNQLDGIKTNNVEELININQETDKFREDKIKPSLSQEDVLKNVKDSSKGFIKGPRTVK